MQLLLSTTPAHGYTYPKYEGEYRTCTPALKSKAETLGPRCEECELAELRITGLRQRRIIHIDSGENGHRIWRSSRSPNTFTYTGIFYN